MLHLSDIWFIAIAVLWAGYLVLEGFDFGVGILLPVLGRNNAERRAMINTIGPVWDGNEVWLLTAAVPRSPPSPAGTRPCSAPSTCRCCWFWCA